MILEACENAALAEGFTRFEMGATLTGVPFYQARGYVCLENLEVPLANGESLPIVRMEKQFGLVRLRHDLSDEQPIKQMRRESRASSHAPAGIRVRAGAPEFFGVTANVL